MLTQAQVQLIGERLRMHGYGSLKEYYASSAWKAVRERKYQATEYKCAWCGTRKKLQVHHLTYKHLCAERLDDLVWLCDPCHERTHGRRGILGWLRFLLGW